MPANIESKKNMTKAAAATGEGLKSGAASWLQRTKDFLGDVRSEMHKVTTPSRKEVETTTAVVILTVFLFAGYFFLVDRAIGFSLDRLLHHLTQR